ncbi:MAG: hypothetical protein EOP88_01280 [Verrucomicrobiaceae bacterium]|nr:MAG: hypothetical protein EOP88_01280 [Verrucomicrobiaceae bacterium]
MKHKPAKFRQRGFALIVTLSLMILLTVIAVGLLTLSVISLRTTAKNDAMSTARANAKLALMLALGDLQKAAGPDKAITAPSDIITENPEKPNLTGVWDSWDYDVRDGSLDYNAPKTRKSMPDAPGFKGWLVSDPKIEGTANRDYPDSAFEGETIELVGKGSLGQSAAPKELVRVGKVAVNVGGKKAGNYAWHVSDESVKARINTYRDTGIAETLSQKRALLAGHRPDVREMKNRDGRKLDFLPDDKQNYQEAADSTGKIVSLKQAELFTNDATVGSFRNDVTPYSMGLLTNVREGGLKQDLTSVFELTTSTASGTTGFPSAFIKTGSTTKRLYETGVFSGGAAVTGVSDPYWSALAGYYNSYKDLLTPDSVPTLYKAPSENFPLTTSLVQPAQFTPAPVIAKVELMFSLLTRDKHGPWKNRPGDYELHMLYIPVITLHNPYNVALRFDRLKVGIVDPPIGFTFAVNGTPRNSLTPLGNLFQGASGRKEFWMEIADWSSATATNPTGPTTMKPGQTLIYGPYINASEPFGDDGASYLDTSNNKTGTEAVPLKAKRGFKGGTYGYDIDWLAGQILNVNKQDKISVDFKPVVPQGSTTFKVVASLVCKGQTKSYGGLSFSYGNQAGLDKILPELQRYPKTGGIVAESMHLGNYENPANSLKAQTFALFSAYARTANGGVDETGSRSWSTASKPLLPDGRISGNPFLHNNPARNAVISDISAASREKPAGHSHELNLLKLDGVADDAISHAADFRTNCLSNYKQVSGRSIKSGSYFEIPSGPLQAISDFRRSNALASPYLPAFVQPVGNSYASPLISTNTVMQTNMAAYPLMDHSFLANHTLYDNFYFSTLAPMGTQSAADGFTQFVENDKPLRTQLFYPYLPAGKSLDDAKGELFSGTRPTTSAYKVAAQYQMVKGAFNVNSTRVQAWKAMLSSMSRSDLNVLWAKSGNLANVASNQVPIPAMTLHNSSATDGSFSSGDIDDQAANQWNGYREFSDADIDKLAVQIVRQVRLRGPFLSMSEFVNRRLGDSSELSRTGALQNAIEDSGLNDNAMVNQVNVSASDVSSPTIYGLKTPEAATGNPAAGAPGWLSQADILKVLEPAATVRSDTFVIRTCGEATANDGTVLARAYAEAVVQRVPEYVNSIDPPAARIPNPNAPSNSVDPTTPPVAKSENVVFGRKFVMVSFKWLTPSEI